MTQYRLGKEFQMRHELAGMAPIDILTQATKTNAEILGLSDVIGEIRNGLCADLALFCGNPDEDFTVIYDRPAHVWKCGELVR